MKELEALEKLEQENNNLKNALEMSLSESQKLRKENYKYQKAIEICKNKKVHIRLLMLAENVDSYNYELLLTEKQLIEEEFNLLKEVFGNERV